MILSHPFAGNLSLGSTDEKTSGSGGKCILVKVKRACKWPGQDLNSALSCLTLTHHLPPPKTRPAPCSVLWGSCDPIRKRIKSSRGQGLGGTQVAHRIPSSGLSGTSCPAPETPMGKVPCRPAAKQDFVPLTIDSAKLRSQMSILGHLLRTFYCSCFSSTSSARWLLLFKREVAFDDV